MLYLDWLFHRGNDLTTQFLPDALFFRDSILSGKFPFWNPWIFAGMPYLLDPQNFLWYPPNYLLLLFRSVELGFLVLLVGHLFFAGYFIKKLLKAFPVWVQLFGVSLFLFSPKLVAHLEEGNWTLVIASTWLPALYWSLINKRIWWTVISLSALLINNLNIGYYSMLFVLLRFLVQFLPRLRKKATGLSVDVRPEDSVPRDELRFGGMSRYLARVARRQAFTRGAPHKSIRDRVPNFVKMVWQAQVFRLLLFVSILTVPRWLPLVMWGDQTVRASLSESPVPFWSWTKIMKSFFIPLLAGHPELQNEEILYVGIVPILLLVWKGLALRPQGQALLSSKGRSFFNGFWLVWLAFVFIVALNVKTPPYWFIEKLPGFSLLRITTRPWIFVSLFVALAVPAVLFQLSQRSRLLAIVVTLGILGEFGVFGYKLFARRVISVDPLPRRFYDRMIEDGTPVRAYCTTGCIDRLTAQRMGIALLHGNNPIQLTAFVRYLEEAGGYHESAYHPILPPYTVFNQKPQPNALLLGKTSSKFMVSPYVLTDSHLVLIDQEGEYRLYENRTDAMMEFSAHHFSL